MVSKQTVRGAALISGLAILVAASGPSPEADQQGPCAASLNINSSGLWTDLEAEEAASLFANCQPVYEAQLKRAHHWLRGSLRPLRRLIRRLVGLQRLEGPGRTYERYDLVEIGGSLNFTVPQLTAAIFNLTNPQSLKSCLAVPDQSVKLIRRKNATIGRDCNRLLKELGGLARVFEPLLAPGRAAERHVAGWEAVTAVKLCRVARKETLAIASRLGALRRRYCNDRCRSLIKS